MIPPYCLVLAVMSIFHFIGLRAAICRSAVHSNRILALLLGTPGGARGLPGRPNLIYMGLSCLSQGFLVIFFHHNSQISPESPKSPIWLLWAKMAKYGKFGKFFKLGFLRHIINSHLSQIWVPRWLRAPPGMPDNSPSIVTVKLSQPSDAARNANEFHKKVTFRKKFLTKLLQQNRSYL